MRPVHETIQSDSDSGLHALSAAILSFSHTKNNLAGTFVTIIPKNRREQPPGQGISPVSQPLDSGSQL